MNSLHRKALGVLAGLAGLFAAGLALAVQPDEVLQDAALEARARALSAELRCLVCQNQSIDDSNAPLARDLRLLVRERLTAGDSDAAVKSFVVERYGTFVLLRPPVDASTILLWMTPLLILAGALMLLLRRMTSGARLVREPVPELSPEDQERLRILLEEPRRAPPNGSRRT